MPNNSSGGASAVPATIAAGQSLSGAVVLGALTLHGILIPSGWIAASLTFQMSPDGVSFYEMDSVSGNLVYPVTAGHYLALDPTLWRAVNILKVRSGTSGSPVVQTGGAVLNLFPTTIP